MVYLILSFNFNLYPPNSSRLSHAPYTLPIILESVLLFAITPVVKRTPSSTLRVTIVDSVYRWRAPNVRRRTKALKPSPICVGDVSIFAGVVSLDVAASNLHRPSQHRSNGGPVDGHVWWDNSSRAKGAELWGFVSSPLKPTDSKVVVVVVVSSPGDV